MPKTPHELKSHNCIRARLPNGTVWGWHFAKKGKSLRVAVDGTLVVNEIDLVVRAALDGAGIAYLLRDYVEADLVEGRLVALLIDWLPPHAGFYLYYSSRRQLPAPLQAFIDFIRTKLHPGAKTKSAN